MQRVKLIYHINMNVIKPQLVVSNKAIKINDYTDWKKIYITIYTYITWMKTYYKYKMLHEIIITVFSYTGFNFVVICFSITILKFKLTLVPIYIHTELCNQREGAILKQNAYNKISSDNY